MNIFYHVIGCIVAVAVGGTIGWYTAEFMDWITDKMNKK